MGYNEDRGGTYSARRREPDRRPNNRRAPSAIGSGESSPQHRDPHEQRDANRNGRDENRDWSPSHQQNNDDNASPGIDWQAGTGGFVHAPISRRRRYFIDRDQPRASFGDFVRRGVVSPVPELRHLLHDEPKWHPPERAPRQEDGYSPDGRRCRERAEPRQASFYATKHDAPRYNRSSRRRGGNQQRQRRSSPPRQAPPAIYGYNQSVAWSDEDSRYNEQRQEERWERQHSPARSDSSSFNHNRQGRDDNGPRYIDEIEPYRSPPRRALAPSNSHQLPDMNKNPDVWDDEADHYLHEQRHGGNSSRQHSPPRPALPSFSRNGNNDRHRRNGKRRGYPARQPRPAPITPAHGGYGLDETAHSNWAAFEAKTAQDSSNSQQMRRPFESTSSPRASTASDSQRWNDERPREFGGSSPRASDIVREVSPRDSFGDSQESCNNSGGSNREGERKENNIAPHYLRFEEGQRLSIEAMQQARKDLRDLRRDKHEPHEECWPKYMTMRRAVHYEAEKFHKNRHAYFDDGTEFERIFGRPQEIDDWWDRQRASVASWVVHQDNEGIRPGGWDLRADNWEPDGIQQWDFPEWVQEEGTPPMKKRDLGEPTRPPSPSVRRRY